MKRFLKFAILALLLPAFIITGCKKAEDDTVDTQSFETLKAYLIANNLDIPTVLTNWVVDAKTIVDSSDYSIPGYYVLDIRSAADFALGHINGAVNTTLANILTAAQGHGTKPILVVCYTGQTAAFGCVALRLSGYADAKILKWGMSCWNPSFDKWTSSTSSSAIGNSNWVTTTVASNVQYNDPTFTTTATDGAAILAERVTAMLATGFANVTNAEVLASPSSYFINNYWPVDTTSKYGHISSAYRILPLSLAGGEYKYYDPSKTCVTYCYTGQTSSMVSAYMNVLGYNAKTLKFGTNSLIYSEMESNKWKSSYNYPVVQ
jgi:rhodanese-related sulfurtransferase